MKLTQTKKFLKLGKHEGLKVVEERTAHKVKSRSSLLLLAEASEVGFSIALPIAAGALFGLWLDNRFKTHPKLTLSFLFLGIFVAFAKLFMLVKDFSRKED